ncbi:MAG: MBL fold metallo-hydrolase [Candidatus Hydrogenedentes bacterium]|nr:MBL fold metallo-hydrolase [Candidatus Hydrogenedentota bacterium]
MEESGAESWAHPHAAERTASYDEASAETGAFYLSIMREFGVPDDAIAAASSDHASFTPYGAQATVSHVLDDGAKVARYTAYHAPGHSSSDTVLFDTERREGFVGDHVLATTNPNPLIRRPPPGQPRPKSLLEFMASLRRTRSLDIDWCCPGHGEPFRNHREVIDRLLMKLDERSERVLNCLQDTPLTPYQLSRCLYPNLETKYVYLGISVAIGHLEVLESDGRVIAEPDNGVARYRKTEGA